MLTCALACVYLSAAHYDAPNSMRFPGTRAQLLEHGFPDVADPWNSLRWIQTHTNVVYAVIDTLASARADQMLAKS